MEGPAPHQSFWYSQLRPVQRVYARPVAAHPDLQGMAWRQFHHFVMPQMVPDSLSGVNFKLLANSEAFALGCHHLSRGVGESWCLVSPGRKWIAIGTREGRRVGGEMLSAHVYLLLPRPAISGKGKQRLLAIYEILN